jgi:hypothetical protein
MIMTNMAQMFSLARQESHQREEVLRGELGQQIGTIVDNMETLKKGAATGAAQVTHLTTAVNNFQEQMDINANYSVDSVQQVRDETKSQLDAMKARFDTMEKLLLSGRGVHGASNPGGTGALSSTDDTLAASMGRPAKVDATKVVPFAIKCAFCTGDVPKSIAKHCVDCDLHFHPGHFQPHREEWPCPLVDHDLCPWCAEHIEEDHNVMQCEVCLYTLHDHCYASHMPCPNGWENKEKSGVKDLSDELDGAVDAPSQPEPPVTPPAVEATNQTTTQATQLAQQFLAQMEAITRGEQPQVSSNYPTSPNRFGQPGSLPLANLGVVPGATGNSGFAVQYGKPREADSVKLLAFPKPGTSFEKWWDHALDSISAATSFCTEAYRWAVECEKSETTFAQLAESGGFVRLDALVLIALMGCMPGDTHLPRQEIKKAKTEQMQT